MARPPRAGRGPRPKNVVEKKNVAPTLQVRILYGNRARATKEIFGWQVFGLFRFSGFSKSSFVATRGSEKKNLTTCQTDKPTNLMKPLRPRPRAPHLSSAVTGARARKDRLRRAGERCHAVFTLAREEGGVEIVAGHGGWALEQMDGSAPGASRRRALRKSPSDAPNKAAGLARARAGRKPDPSWRNGQSKHLGLSPDRSPRAFDPSKDDPEKQLPPNGQKNYSSAIFRCPSDQGVNCSPSFRGERDLGTEFADGQMPGARNLSFMAEIAKSADFAGWVRTGVWGCARLHARGASPSARPAGISCLRLRPRGLFRKKLGPAPTGSSSRRGSRAMSWNSSRRITAAFWRAYNRVIKEEGGKKNRKRD